MTVMILATMAMCEEAERIAEEHVTKKGNGGFYKGYYSDFLDKYNSVLTSMMMEEAVEALEVAADPLRKKTADPNSK